MREEREENNQKMVFQIKEFLFLTPCLLYESLSSFLFFVRILFLSFTFILFLSLSFTFILSLSLSSSQWGERTHSFWFRDSEENFSTSLSSRMVSSFQSLLLLLHTPTLHSYWIIKREREKKMSERERDRNSLWENLMICMLDPFPYILNNMWVRREWEGKKF